MSVTQFFEDPDQMSITLSHRTLRKEYFQWRSVYMSEKKSGLPLRLALLGLTCVADRAGRFPWQPDVIRLHVLPYDVCDFSAVMDALHQAGMIRRYSHGEAEYGEIKGFDKMQFLNPKERHSRIPAFEDGVEIEPPEEPVVVTDGPRIATLAGDGGSDTSKSSQAGKKKPRKEVQLSDTHFMVSGFRYRAESEGSVLCVDHMDFSDAVCWFDMSDGSRSGVSAAKAEELGQTFQGLDIIACLRQAAQWVRDNPERRKTRAGLANYLRTWCDRSQNRGGPRNANKSSPRGLLPANSDDLIAALIRSGVSQDAIPSDPIALQALASMRGIQAEINARGDIEVEVIGRE